MELVGNWSYPTRVRFGTGRIAELPQVLEEAKIVRPLFVTDSGLAGTDMVQRAIASVEAAGKVIGSFADINSNPGASAVADAVRVLREGGYDGVIAFGGGSALDVGKVAAFMAGQHRSLWDFEDIGDYWSRANVEGILPIVAVPTTAGTGSEVGRAGAICDEATRTKKIIFHPLMMPRVVICDPELTVGMPKALTVGTGMDAFSHCLEAFCAASYHPIADGIALEGMRLVKENLPMAVDDGHNLEARAQMMAAAAMGAAAFQKGLGAIHALSHPVGSLYDTHHGMTNAVFIPYVLAFNRRAIENKVVRLAAYLGLVPTFDAFMTWILEIRAQMQVPHVLRDLGVDENQAELIADMAVRDPTAAGNPVALDTSACRQILAAALA